MIEGIGWAVLGELKRDVYHGSYQKVVEDVGALVNLFYNEPESNWGEVFRALYEEINSLTKWIIGHNEKEYLKSFLMCAIKTMKGRMTINEFKKKTTETQRLLSNPYSC